MSSDEAAFFFTIDWWAFWLVLGGVSLFGFYTFYFQKQTNQPGLFYTQLKDLDIFPKNYKVRLAFLPNTLKVTALLFLLLAFTRPTFHIKENPLDQGEELSDQEDQSQELEIPVEGIALYFVLDQSSSMREEVSFVKNKKRFKGSRLDLLKRFTVDFIQASQNKAFSNKRRDLVGLLTFARVVQVHTPLTLDYQEIVRKLVDLETVEYQDQDGTALGYAIYRTANIIDATRRFAKELKAEGKPSYSIKNSVIVLVTDGFHNPNPMDQGHRYRQIELLEAARFSQEKNIRLYIINIEPAIEYERFSQHKQRLQKAAEITGGQFYVADEMQTLKKIYNHIGQLEKSQFVRHYQVGKEDHEQLMDQELSHYHKKELFPYLIFASMGLILFSYGLQTLVIRQVP